MRGTGVEVARGINNRVQVYADGIGYNVFMTPEEVADLVRKHVWACGSTFQK